MMSFCEKKISAKVQLIHAEQMSLCLNFIALRKNNRQLKTENLKQDILNQWESMGFSKLSYINVYDTIKKFDKFSGSLHFSMASSGEPAAKKAKKIVQS